MGAPAQPSAPAPSRFHRLSPAEQQECRRQGLCFNYDESYVPGHVCQRLFYLVNVDDDDVPAEAAVAAVFQEERTPAPHP